MKFVIETARHQHLVKGEKELRAKHARFVAKLVANGSAAQIHESAEPKVVRVNHGVWLFDCDCGSGVAADHGFSAAYCHGCGAIHTNVVWPSEADRTQIEQALLARPKTANRNWDPDESLAALIADNDAHGVKR